MASDATGVHLLAVVSEDGAGGSSNLYTVQLPSEEEPLRLLNLDDLPLVRSDPEPDWAAMGPVQWVPDITGDADPDLVLVERRRDTSESTPYERVHLFDGGIGEPLGGVDDSQFMWEVEGYDVWYAGTNVAVFDQDWDGAEDLVVGVGSGVPWGEVWRFAGPLEGGGGREQPWSGDRLTGDSVYSLDDEPVGRVDDLDGDGLDELVIASRAGSLLLYGGAPWPTRAADLRDGIANLGAGTARSAGDFDGDGYGDLVTTRGCYSGCSPGVEELAGLVFAGPVSGWKQESDRLVGLWQAAWDESTRSAPVGVGDLDSDGFGELAIGEAYREEYSSDGAYTDAYGAVYLVAGGLCGDVDLETDATVVSSPAANSYFGASTFPDRQSVFGLGDVDGGGVGDLLVQEVYDSPEDPDAALAFLFLGEDVFSR